jgi:hypothetical protein
MYKQLTYLLLLPLFHGCESPTALTVVPGDYGDHDQYLSCKNYIKFIWKISVNSTDLCEVLNTNKKDESRHFLSILT